MNSNKLIWKILNRTIYNENDDFWLRRDMREVKEDLTLDEKHVIKKLKEHGLKYVYDEQTFYDMFKVTRKDFLDKIEKADDSKRDKLIFDIIYK
jgi:hypothetical protein